MLNNLMDCEQKNSKKLVEYQLPHFFKKIGIYLAIISFVYLLVNEFFIEDEVSNTVAKYALLIGLLFVSISKDKVTDELLDRLRMQSYSYAFVFGVIVSLFQPITNYVVDSVQDEGEVSWDFAGDFQILLVLLLLQVFYYAYLKRLYR